jgi:hypothetical protein
MDVKLEDLINVEGEGQVMIIGRGFTKGPIADISTLRMLPLIPKEGATILQLAQIAGATLQYAELEQVASEVWNKYSLVHAAPKSEGQEDIKYLLTSRARECTYRLGEGLKLSD